MSIIIEPVMSRQFASSPREIGAFHRIRSCSVSRGVSFLPSDRGSVARTRRRTTTPAIAIVAKVARQLRMPPIHVPKGTPAAIDPVTPSETAAMYLPTLWAGACWAVKANSAGVVAAATSAVATRSVVNTMNDLVIAAAMFEVMKISSAVVNSWRRGTFARTMAATGAVMATVRENTVTSCPAWPSVICRSVASSGRIPAIT